MAAKSNSDFPLLEIGALAGMVVLIGVVGFVFVRGNLDEGTRLTREQLALSTELTELTELMGTIQSGEEVLESLQGHLGDLQSQIPDSMDFQSFYGALTRLTGEHRIHVSEIRPGTVQEAGALDRMPVSMRARSAFVDLHRFLDSVSLQSRVTRLERLDITPANEPGQCDFEMSLYIYSSRQE